MFLATTVTSALLQIIPSKTTRGKALLYPDPRQKSAMGITVGEEMMVGFST